MIYSRKFGAWTFEILWSYGIGIGFRCIPRLRLGGEHQGFALDVPLLILLVWR